MTQDARQAAEATDYEAKARELADVWAMGILAALQSAHAAGHAKGDAAGFERGVRAATVNGGAKPRKAKALSWGICKHCGEAHGLRGCMAD